MATRKRTIWNWFDNIQGDRVIWIIVILLTLLSINAIFSSTSLSPAVLAGKTTRVKLFLEQLLMVGIGFGFLLAIYAIPGIKFFRFVSQFCFLISLFLLVLLFSHANLGVIKAQYINKAWRTLSIFGFQLHVFEVVKVLMIMYLAWAVDAWKAHHFKVANALAEKVSWLAFLDKPFWQGIVYIFFPMMITCFLLISGSVSTVLFVGMIMFATIFIGGFSKRDTILYIVIIVGALVLGYGLYKATDGKALAKVYDRIETAISRIDRYTDDSDMSVIEQIEAAPNSTARQALVDKYLQSEGAKIAIHEGGLLGKGPGRSTQKYRVPLMFGDYMYSFLIEEYGLWMAALVLALFVSLMARGSKIAMNCTRPFARTAVGGLTLLISGQGMMHMMINVGLLPITGQTLPMVSDGKTSLLMFSIAFGILLSISKMAKKQMDKEIQRAPDIIPESTGDDVADSMNDLDVLESIE